MKYPLLFTPFDLGAIKVPNRVAMSAMSTHLSGPDGAVTKEQIAYYRERALGGAGLIVVEYTCVDSGTGLGEYSQLRLDKRHLVKSHVPLVEVIKDAGARVLLQLHHAGRCTTPAAMSGRQTVAPSPLPFPLQGGCMPKQLEDAEIRRLITCFVQSAQWAMEVGYDGIELHGAHGYLLEQFLSPYTNFRDDAWGGDFERRLAFPCAVIEAIRKAIGPDRALTYRMSAIEYMPGGLEIEDTERAAPFLARAGLDAISVTMGTFDSLEMVVEPMSAVEGWRLPYCGRIRRAAAIPVIASGMVRTPEMAEAALAAGEGDMITLGRPLLADPTWPNKARNGQSDDIRPCTTCNFCVGRGAIHRPTACAENPRAGKETDPPIPVFGRERLAVVVGGGPGGVVAALLLDQAGFQVNLYEARADIGGGLVVSATPPHKDKLFRYLDYLRRRLSASKVEVFLNTRATAQSLQAQSPAIIVVAAGAPVTDMAIEGADADTVDRAYDLLIGDTALRVQDLRDQLVTVYGGGETGCETAEYLAQHGAQVALVTRSPKQQLARSAERFYRRRLLERIELNPTIAVHESATISKINEEEVIISSGAGSSSIPSHYTFIAQGQSPDPTLSEELGKLQLPYIVIGDSVKVRRIGDAVADAYRGVFLLSERLAEPKVAC